MSSRAEKKRVRRLARRVVADLPAEQRGRWLVSFSRLYREALAATRAKRFGAKRRPFRIFPPAWRVKFAMACHVLAVHRYKERDEFLLAPCDDVGEVGTDVDQDVSGPPEWMIEDFKSFAGNEPSLWPDRDFLAHFAWYKPFLSSAPGRLYFELYSSLAATKIDAVVICPWLKRGGADKGVLQFVEYYANRGGVALVTTLAADSPWLERVPPGVRAVEFGRLAEALSEAEKIAVLARLLLELAPRIVHVVNSDFGWRCFSQHGTALQDNGAVLVGSLFGEEVRPDGRRFGYAIAYLPKVRDFLDLIVTDNAPYAELLRRRYHMSEQRVRPVPFWHALEPLSSATGLPDPSVKAASILWAGRLCYQKRPDLLFAIAQACQDVEFHVFGQVEETKFVATWRRKLAALPNVRMYGAYEDFRSFAERRSYRAFLYTTAFDGLPNVLLEAANHRLPIVAPDQVGGLSDFVNAETAFTVEDADEAEGYIRALRQCLADPEEASRRTQNAFDLVRARHSREAFDVAMDAALQDVERVVGSRQAPS